MEIKIFNFSYKQMVQYIKLKDSKMEILIIISNILPQFNIQAHIS